MRPSPLPWLLTAAVAGAATAALADRAMAQLPPLVERYCAECHTGEHAEEGLDLTPLFAADRAALLADASAQERLAVVQRRLRSRTMPPDDSEQPGAAEAALLAVAFAGLQVIDADARTTTVRRLSRSQYERTVRDLTGVAFRGKDLLPDDARTDGFDNLGGAASITPLLFEKYFAAAAWIAEAMLADPALRVRLLRADEPLAATLPPFLGRAFRRPASDAEVAERLALRDDLVGSGLDERSANIALLQSILASPGFLFRAEHGRPAAPTRLTSHELAGRLAYALTTSMPDDELLAKARSGELDDASVLAAEARRLAAQDDGRALAEDFAAQWLRLRDVLTATADSRRYPQIWNAKLRPAFYEEAVQLFQALVRDDLSILVLLDADFTYANATLAKHYGLPDVKGEAFRRVELPDRRRGGVLGMAAMLMVSSYPLRTSPVVRGRWILDQLLDAPPPPPPADAGVLPPDDQQADELTLRQRLERHRRDRSCASCHAQIDPLGFALENYDVLGLWREQIHGKPVDARGELADGAVIDGPIALKDALLLRKLDFARAMTKKLLVYAIGRPLVHADEVEVARLVAAIADGEFRFSALLTAVVTSPLFTERSPGVSR